MSNVQEDLTELAQSQAQAHEYPLNLVRASDFRYVLETYRSRLEKEEKKLFSARRSLVVIWDLVKAQDTTYVESMANDVEELRSALEGSATDPCRRFIFLQSASSRDPLRCTREQLTLLLTHHQVMASFLEVVFTFKRRENPHSFTSFRCEDYLSPHHQQAGLQSIGRSGIRLQHCFNILGIEEDNEVKDTWRLRQTAAYHSFDLVEGRALWVVMKGNAKMRQRIETTTKESAQKRRGSLNSVQDSFGQTLDDHLLILQWCVENWEAYTESLEVTYRPFSSITEHAPVKELADDIPTNRAIDRMNSLRFEVAPRRHTDGSQSAPAPQTLLRRLSTKLTDLSAKSSFHGTLRRGTGLINGRDQAPLSPKIKNLKLEELVSFKMLQDLNSLDKSLDEAISVIDQNKRVLTDIKSHYWKLVNSAAFELHVAESSALQSCKEHASDFVQRIERLEGDLDNYQGNLKTILRGVGKTGVMFNSILQHQSMRTAEYFAKSSEDSAGVMQIWTEQMHEKTMSMHVITVFTLIFLPGTFVATIFGSGILTFGDDGSSGSGPNMGDWKVRLAGLKLFLAICFPLMTLTLCAWLMAYCFARLRRSSPRDSGVLSEKVTEMV